MSGPVVGICQFVKEHYTSAFSRHLITKYFFNVLVLFNLTNPDCDSIMFICWRNSRFVSVLQVMLLADSQKACGKLTCMVISAGTANVMLELIRGRSSAKAYDSTPSSWEMYFIKLSTSIECSAIRNGSPLIKD